MSRAETVTQTRTEAVEVERAVCPECGQQYAPEEMMTWYAKPVDGSESDVLAADRCPDCGAGLLDLDETPGGSDYVGPTSDVSEPRTPSEFSNQQRSGEGRERRWHPIRGILNFLDYYQEAITLALAVGIALIVTGTAPVVIDAIVNLLSGLAAWLLIPPANTVADLITFGSQNPILLTGFLIQALLVFTWLGGHRVIKIE